MIFTGKTSGWDLGISAKGSATVSITQSCGELVMSKDHSRATCNRKDTFNPSSNYLGKSHLALLDKWLQKIAKFLLLGKNTQTSICFFQCFTGCHTINSWLLTFLKHSAPKQESIRVRALQENPIVLVFQTQCDLFLSIPCLTLLEV